MSRFFARNFLGAGGFRRRPGAPVYTDRKRLTDAAIQLCAVEWLPAREVMNSMYRRQGAELRRRRANH
jgi:hypothetical protein